MVRILGDPRRQDRFLATGQFGITAASLGIGMYGEAVLAERLAAGLDWLGCPEWLAAHVVASTVAVAVLTFLHLLFGEMVPKAVALRRSDRIVLGMVSLMTVLEAVLYPFVVLFNAAGNVVLRLFGIRRRERSAEQFHTPEELRYIVSESEEGGLLRPESGAVLRRLFDFGDLTAAAMMVPRVAVMGLPLGSPPAEAARILRSSPCTRIPVIDGDLDHVVGMLHVKDLLRLLREGRNVERDAVRPVPFVPATAEAGVVLSAMRAGRAQMAVVMDEHGGTSGLITMDDLLEEVIGEVRDVPGARPDLWRDPEGRLHAAGTVRVEEVGEVLGVALEHPEVESVSGLVLALLNRPPKAGDVVEYDGVRFLVTAVAGRGVREVVATLVTP